MKLRASVLALVLVAAGAARAQEPGGWISRMLQLPIPSTMEFCGEPVPLERRAVGERLDLELVVTLGSPVRTTLWFKRAPRYFPMIEAYLREHGLPEDLKYVALVESNLRADASSSAGAAGPWQFVRSTGLSYGLRRNSWRDERRDWDDSTEAALEHLVDLHEFFASWPLALAAYNAGKRRVLDAMESQGQRDYYGLQLPRETERYVFRVLAAKLVYESPRAYGIDLEGARLYEPHATVEVTVDVTRRELPLSAVAAAAGVSYWELLDLNPWLVGDSLPRGCHALEVPEAGEAGFGAALAAWERDNPEPASVYYRVSRGDTLSGIARRHGVALRDLLAWNSLSSKSVIRPGQELVVHTVD